MKYLNQSSFVKKLIFKMLKIINKNAFKKIKKIKNEINLIKDYYNNNTIV